MKKIISNLFAHKTLSNLIHVGFIKFANIFAKYFLVLYLVRVLGEKSYGALTWIDSFIQYLLVYINFGFDLFIVKKIIEKKDNKIETDKIISSVLTLKLFLFLSSFLILFFLINLLAINEYVNLFILMLFMGIGEVFFPLWYFQGIQKMKYMSLTSLISKSVLVLLTLFLVTSPNDLLLYIIILVFSNALYGGFGYFFLNKVSNFIFTFPSFLVIKKYFIEGFLFYLGRTSTLFMNFGTIFIIGKFFAKDLVTGFDISSKIIFVFVFVFEVIQQSVFPGIVESKNKTKLLKLFIFTFLLSIIFYLTVYFFSDFFLFFLGGSEMLKYIYLLKKLSILIPIIGVTTILGSCGLVAFGAIKKFNFSFIISAVLYILSIFILQQLDILTFQNIILIRILVDLLMAMIILYHSIQLKLFEPPKT